MCLCDMTPPHFCVTTNATHKHIDKRTCGALIGTHGTNDGDTVVSLDSAVHLVGKVKDVVLNSTLHQKGKQKLSTIVSRYHILVYPCIAEPMLVHNLASLVLQLQAHSL